MVFYFTDVHGNDQMFHRMLSWCKEQDPKCMIIYGGDAADRGSNGYNIIRELLNEPSVIYIYGNHEDMFVNAAYSLIEKYSWSKPRGRLCSKIEAHEIIMNEYINTVAVHMNNGGLPTLTSWIMDGAPHDILGPLQCLPRTFSVGKYDFCHAGGTYAAFEEVQAQELSNRLSNLMYEYELIWDRRHLSTKWHDNRVVVFGHTPVISLPGHETDISPVVMGNGSRICMDSGLYWTEVGLVMDVKRGKFYRFEKDGSVNEVAV